MFLSHYVCEDDGAFLTKKGCYASFYQPVYMERTEVIEYSM